MSAQATKTLKHDPNNVVYPDFAKGYKKRDDSFHNYSIDNLLGENFKEKLAKDIRGLLVDEIREQVKNVGVTLKEYTETVSHDLSKTKSENVGGENLVSALTMHQVAIVKELSNSSNVRAIYSYGSSVDETIIVVLDDDDSEFIMELSKIYWNLFDQFEEYPTEYSFDFEPMSIEEFYNVELSESIKEIFNRE